MIPQHRRLSQSLRKEEQAPWPPGQGALSYSSMLMALTGQPSRASWAASSWPSGMPLPWATPSSPMWKTSGQVPAHRPQPMQFSFTVAFISFTPNLLQNISIPAQCHHLPGDELTALPQRRLRRPLDAAAAGDVHPDDGQLPDVVAAKDLRQLLGVVPLVQLGAADQGDVVAHEPLVEVRPGVGRAVRRDQQPGAVEPGGLHRHQLDLHRPLGQMGHRAVRNGRGRSGGCIRCPQGLGHAAGAASGGRHLPGRGALQGLRLLGQHGGLIIGRRLPLHKADGPRGAGGQAVSQAVAVVVPQQRGLAVHHADGALVAGRGTGAAAVALLLVDLNDPSYHSVSPLMGVQTFFLSFCG